MGSELTAAVEVRHSCVGRSRSGPQDISGLGNIVFRELAAPAHKGIMGLFLTFAAACPAVLRVIIYRQMALRPTLATAFRHKAADKRVSSQGKLTVPICLIGILICARGFTLCALAAPAEGTSYKISGTVTHMSYNPNGTLRTNATFPFVVVVHGTSWSVRNYFTETRYETYSFTNGTIYNLLHFSHKDFPAPRLPGSVSSRADLIDGFPTTRVTWLALASQRYLDSEESRGRKPKLLVPWGDPSNWTYDCFASTVSRSELPPHLPESIKFAGTATPQGARRHQINDPLRREPRLFSWPTFNRRFLPLARQLTSSPTLNGGLFRVLSRTNFQNLSLPLSWELVRSAPAGRGTSAPFERWTGLATNVARPEEVDLQFVPPLVEAADIIDFRFEERSHGIVPISYTVTNRWLSTDDPMLRSLYKRTRQDFLDQLKAAGKLQRLHPGIIIALATLVLLPIVYLAFRNKLKRRQP
jgi:hypothetical protein